MQSSTPQRPRAAHVVAQTLQFYQSHWRAVLPLGLLLLPCTALTAWAPVNNAAGAPPASSFWLWFALTLAVGVSMQVMGAALVETPSWPRAVRRCRTQAGALMHVSALQMGRAAWALGLRVLTVGAALGGVIGLTFMMASPLPWGIGWGEGALLFSLLIGVLSLVPVVRLTLEFYVMTQFVVTGTGARAAHHQALELCRGNLGWLARGYFMAILPPMALSYALLGLHYYLTGSVQLSAAHPLFYANAVLTCCMAPFTCTFPAVAVRALRRVPTQEVEVCW